MTARPQLVIFDLDGTLTDSARGIVSSFRHALAHVGEDPDLAGLVVGPPMHQTLRSLGLGEKADAAIAAYRADYTARGWVLGAGASPDGVRATKADVVAHVLSQLDTLPEHILMVGDRSHDVHGASRHGIDTVVVEWGYGRLDFDDPTVERPLAHVGSVAVLREVLGV